MNTFANAIQTPSMTTTENGMPALEHTGHTLTNLFFNIGSARNDRDSITKQFAKAFGEDPIIATKIMFWCRDIRSGAGERQTFRTLLQTLESMSWQTVVKNIHLIPKFGRWDDGWCLQTKPCKEAWMSLIAKTLRNQTEGYQLCAKWQDRKGPNAVALRNWMNLSPKFYRKMLVNDTRVVETNMCAQNWTNIQYNHVPSIAAKQYMAAFMKHDAAGYSAYKTSLTKGEAKINASAIFPHDVIQGMKFGNKEVAQAQWNALPNYLGDDYILPVVDVSGSMDCPAGESKVTCLDVALSLGLYIANKQQGAFHNVFCTFSEKPELIVLKNDTLYGQMHEMNSSNWGMNTNLEAVFKLVLEKATTNNVSQNQMPKIIMIMSDMQFDQCINEPNDTAFQMIQRMYSETGYQMPKVVFWNLDAKGNAPVSFKENGTALISGFSPAIMKPLLKCESITPWDVMCETINSERYNEVSV